VGYELAMTADQSISDDDISREGSTEDQEDRDTGTEHGKDTGDEPTEAIENLDAGGEGARDVGDD
jgi:hypothetical protein